MTNTEKRGLLTLSIPALFVLILVISMYGSFGLRAVAAGAILGITNVFLVLTSRHAAEKIWPS